MIKHILIPIDFSDCSINALKYAVQFANTFPSSVALTILNCYSIPIAYSDLSVSFGPGLADGDIEKRIEKEFKNLKKTIPLLTNLPHKFIMRNSALAEAMRAYKTENTIDLIVMGTIGASGIDEVVLGSNAHRIIKADIAPTLVIPQFATFKSLENIALSNDYKGVSLEALDLLKVLAKLSHAKIHLAHISKEPLLDVKKAEEARNLAVHLKTIPQQFHFLVDDDIEHGITAFIQKEEIDLLVLVPRKKGLFEGLFRKSESKPLIFHSKIPLLALISD